MTRIRQVCMFECFIALKEKQTYLCKYCNKKLTADSSSRLKQQLDGCKQYKCHSGPIVINDELEADVTSLVSQNDFIDIPSTSSASHLAIDTSLNSISLPLPFTSPVSASPFSPPEPKRLAATTNSNRAIMGTFWD